MSFPDELSEDYLYPDKFVNAKLIKNQVYDEPIIVEPSEDFKEENFDMVDKINPHPKNIIP